MTNKAPKEKVDPIRVYAQANNITYQQATANIAAEEKRDTERKTSKRAKPLPKKTKPANKARLARSDKFKPKLEANQRHAYYAAFHSHRDIFSDLNDSECYKLIASISQLNRSSVHRLLDNSYKEYGPVKREFAKLGGKEFDKQYLDANTLERIESAATEWNTITQRLAEHGNTESPEC